MNVGDVNSADPSGGVDPTVDPTRGVYPSMGDLQGSVRGLAEQFQAHLQLARQNMTAGQRYAFNGSQWQPTTDAARGVKTPTSDAPVAPPNNPQSSNSQPPVNPYVRGAQETDGAWQQRVTEATNAAIRRSQSDPKGATDEFRKINGALAQSPGFDQNYFAHAQNVSPDFFHNPTAYNVREVSDPVSEIPNVSDRIAHFTAANGSAFEAIAADGKVYDISRAQGVRTDGHWTTSLYEHNDQMIRYNDQQEKGPSADTIWAAAGLVGSVRQPGAMPQPSSGSLPVAFDGAFATQQLLGTTTTPGGRQIMFHAADRMVNPPKGRIPMSPAEIDQVLDGATKVVKRSYHPEGNTLTIENRNMFGRPRVIVDEATGQRVITVINPRTR